MEFFLNPASTSVAVCNPASQNCFAGWHWFPPIVSSDLNPGINTLTAKVHNDGTYTGLIVNAELHAKCKK
ncbi:MAG: hypothetical protein ACXWID_07805 [Pyrinomonadaceae bacterium]